LVPLELLSKEHQTAEVTVTAPHLSKSCG